jgi:hypothetical protein
MTIRPARSLALAALVVAASAGAGCLPAFDPYNRLLSLRVLAISSEPVAPAPGETTTLAALVYRPRDQTDPTYAWSWCPVVGPSTEGYPCLVTEAEASAALGQPVSFDLGSAPTAQLINSFTPAQLTAACQAAGAGQPQPPDCATAFPVSVILKVTGSDSVGGSDVVTAILPLDLLIDANQPRNANPTISQPAATLAGDTVPTDLTATGGDPAGPLLPRFKETPIGVVVPDSASETYMGTDINGDPGPVREQLSLTWFVETGDTQHVYTSFIDGVVALDDASKNQWTPAVKKTYAPDDAELIVVVRDDRGGAAWTSGFVRLEDAP